MEGIIAGLFRGACRWMKLAHGTHIMHGGTEAPSPEARHPHTHLKSCWKGSGAMSDTAAAVAALQSPGLSPTSSRGWPSSIISHSCQRLGRCAWKVENRSTCEE